MKTEEKLAHIKTVLEDMKAEDVVVIDATSRTIMADAFVIATATSDTHARAMGDRMHLALKAQGVRVDHAEMDSGRDWTIMDYGDVVVHIFLEKARRYYNIEELWGHVAEVREKHQEKTSGETPAKPAKAKAPKKPMSAGMERLAEETRAARGTKTAAPTYRSGAKRASATKGARKKS